MNKPSKKILIFRTGQLGDTLVSVPSIWAIRKHYPDAHLTLLCDRHFGKPYVKASSILEGSGLVDNILFYSISSSWLWRVLEKWKLVILLVKLRVCKFETVVYLAPSLRSQRQIDRDIRFFRLAGIKEFIGKDVEHLPEKIAGKALPKLPQEGDLLLQRLARSGIPVQPTGLGCMDLNITSQEKAAVDNWISNLPSDGGRKWLGLGIGGKRPVTLWPAERYGQLVQKLIENFDLWPVIFGGVSDVEIGQMLVSQWGQGYVAAGILSVRQGIAALSRCVLFVGNDSGTIHMAAAAGVRCVGIYSAHNYPGNWDPYGTKHIVLRKTVPCEGCVKDVCPEYNMQCILSIDVNEVYQACAKILNLKN